MSRTSRYAFILAKMYGVIARSYVGTNFRDLLRLKKLAELSDLLFPGERGEAATNTTAVELEARHLWGDSRRAAKLKPVRSHRSRFRPARTRYQISWRSTHRSKV